MPDPAEARSLPDRGECARLSARLETLRTEFDERIQAKDVALADQERVVIGVEAERDRLRVERDGFDEQCRGFAQAAAETNAEVKTLKEEQVAFVRDLEKAQAENERLREDAFTPDEIKLMAREISGMCDNAADGGSIPPALWRQLANKLDRLARTTDDKRRCGRCFYDGIAPTTAEHAMCEAEGGHQWGADASRETMAPNGEETE